MKPFHLCVYRGKLHIYGNVIGCSMVPTDLKHQMAAVVEAIHK